MAHPLTKLCHYPNSFVVVTVNKTFCGVSNKLEDSASEKCKAFSVPNRRI